MRINFCRFLPLLFLVFAPFLSGQRSAIAETNITENVTGLAFSPDGSSVAAAILTFRNGKPIQGRLCLWQTNTGKMLWKISVTGLRGYYKARLNFSPDGKLISLAHGHNLSLHKAEDGSVTTKLQNPDEVMFEQLFFSPDGKIVIGPITLEAPTSALVVWDAQSGAIRGVGEGLLPLGLQGPSTMAFSPDGKFLAVPGLEMDAEKPQESTGLVRIREIATNEVALNFTLPEHVPVGVTYAPNGKTLASWGGRRIGGGNSLRASVVTFDMESNSMEMQARADTEKGLVHSLAVAAAFSTDSQYLSAVQGAWTQEQCALKYLKWKVGTAEPETETALLTMPAGDWTNASVRLSPDGENVLVGYGNGNVELRSGKNGEVVRQFKE